jgi:twinkle protein
MEEEREAPTEQYVSKFKLNTPELKQDIIPLHDLSHEYRTEIDQGFTTGWKGLDYYMQGIRKGELTVVTADTGVGKTTFCLNLLVNCVMQGIPVWINSWEMKPEIVMRKIASIVLRKPMKMCSFTEEDNIAFNAFTSSHSIYVNPNTIGTDMDKFAKSLLIANGMGVKVVLIDHLDYLVRDNKDKLHEAIDETVKRLHELAFLFNIHLILICHPRQSSAAQEEVGMHGLKGSSSIKQYADNIIILHRCSRTEAQADPNKVKIKVAKNRMFGTEGTTYLYYQPSWDGYLEKKNK